MDDQSKIESLQQRIKELESEVAELKNVISTLELKIKSKSQKGPRIVRVQTSSGLD